MNLRKIIVLILVVPVLFVVAAAGLLLAFFDANEYKQELATVVKQQTGRTLTFEGGVNLMLFPSIGMKLGALKFENASGFSQKTMLQVNEVSISVDVKSILKMKPKVSQLTLDGLQVNLQKNKQGKTNWDDLLVADDPSAVAITTQTSTKQSNNIKNGEAESSRELALAFGGININNAFLSWQDEQSEEHIVVDDLDIQTGVITLKEAFPLSVQLVMHKGSEINAALNLESNVYFDLKTKELDLKQMLLSLKAQGELLPFEQSDINFSGDIHFATQTEKLRINGLILAAKLRGKALDTAELNLETQLSFDLKTQQLGLLQTALTVYAKDESLPRGVINLMLNTDSLDVKLAKREVHLANLLIDIEGQKIIGQVDVADYAKPAVKFNLSSESLDLDALLLLNQKQAQATTEASLSNDVKFSEAAEDIAIELPIELIKSLEVDGVLQVDSLKAMNIKTQNNVINIQAKDGVVFLNPLSVALYDGTIKNNITLDVNAASPKYRIKSKLDSVKVGELLTDFMQMDKIAGSTSALIDVNTGGDSVNQLKQKLSGKVAFELRDGALKGFNIRHSIDTAKAKLQGGETSEAKVQQTDFSALSISGDVKNGVLHSDDLMLQSPLLRVGGNGRFDIAKSTLDYRVDAKILGSIEGQASKHNSGLLIPVRLYGSLSDIKLNVLYDDMLKQQAKEKLAAEKERLQQALTAKKAKLNAELDAKEDKLKADLAQRKESEKAKLKAKEQVEQARIAAELEAKKQAEKQRLDAKKKAAEEKLKEKAKNKLKNLF
ncbi:MAG: AsmA family protein [Gammaproteobacteria bacterium]|nr:AsmA family protein [Gammaproteobacteria bacterium]